MPKVFEPLQSTLAQRRKLSPSRVLIFAARTRIGWSCRKKKGGLTRPAETRRLRGHETFKWLCADRLGSGGVTNLAAYFVASFVVNRRQIVLLAAMLFCLAQHFIGTGTFRFP